LQQAPSACLAPSHSFELSWVLWALGLYASLVLLYSITGLVRHRKLARGGFVVRLGIEVAALFGAGLAGYKMIRGYYACVFGVEDYFIFGISLIVIAYLLLRHIFVLMSEPF